MEQAGLDAGSFFFHQLPGVGAVLDASDAVTGCDAISGRDLSPFQRVLAGGAAGLSLLGMMHGDEDAALAGADCGCGLCLSAGTPMWMADGSHQPIEAVQAGDRVLSRDPQTGKDSVRTVTATIQRPADALVTLSLADPSNGKTEALTCTPDHPLYVVGQGWVEAGSLGVGTSIVTRAGPALTVKDVQWQRAEDGSKPFTVYNLTVEEDHTYFAGSVDGGVWAHNTVCEYQIGIFKDLNRDGEVGDDLTPHHIPQGHPAEQVIPGYVYNDGLAIMLSKAMHEGLPATSRLRGVFTGSSRSLISIGLRDLYNAGVPINKLSELAQAIKNAYPGEYL